MRKRISAIIAILTAAAVITGCQTKDNAPSGDGAESTASESTSTASTTSNAPTAEAETPAAATAEAEKPVVVVTAEPAVPTAEVSAPEAEAVTSIKPGTWRGTDSYFFFYEDGKGGSTLDFEYGMGLGFEYDLTQDGHLIFHMGSVDSDLSTSYVLDGDTLRSSPISRSIITWRTTTAMFLRPPVSRPTTTEQLRSSFTTSLTITTPPPHGTRSTV